MADWKYGAFVIGVIGTSVGLTVGSCAGDYKWEQRLEVEKEKTEACELKPPHRPCYEAFKIVPITETDAMRCDDTKRLVVFPMQNPAYLMQMCLCPNTKSE